MLLDGAMEEIAARPDTLDAEREPGRNQTSGHLTVRDPRLSVGIRGMSFWFQEPDALSPGASITIEYWLAGGTDRGSQVATPVPYLSANEDVFATGQGQRYDHSTGKFIYSVTFKNLGAETAAFQTRGGGLT
jgi:hypothetical protein